MKKLRTAIIGMGVVGKRRKYFIEKNNNYQIVAVSDIKFKKNIKKNKIYYYKNYKSIEFHKLDCVFVTLPNYLAPIVTSKFLKKNISVFCEKQQEEFTIFSYIRIQLFPAPHEDTEI